MNLFIKETITEKIPTSKGTFLGLPKSQSTRNLEVGDYFCIFSEKEDLLVFIQREWEKIWFLNVIDDTIVGEIEYNVLTDKINVIESSDDFIDIYNQELNQLKIQLKLKQDFKNFIKSPK
jgi:hypothetical protein